MVIFPSTFLGLLLVVSSVTFPAFGVDIFGFPGSGTACKGGAYMCKEIGKNKCCDFNNLNVNRIRWRGFEEKSLAIAYTGGRCAKQLTSNCGHKDTCAQTAGTTGASWKLGCTDPKITIAGCQSSMRPNAVSFVYTDQGFLNFLVLETENLAEAMEELETWESDRGKVEYLLARGALQQVSSKLDSPTSDQRSQNSQVFVS